MKNTGKTALPIAAPSNTVTDTVMDIYAKHFGTAQTIERFHPNIAAFIRDLNQFERG